MTAEEKLRDSIFKEIFWMLGLADHTSIQKILRPLLLPAVKHASQVLSDLDQQVQRDGLPESLRSRLPRFINELTTYGAELIPQESPLLIASNHPAAFDLPLIISTLHRDDVKTITSEVSIFRHLENIGPHFIQIGHDVFRRSAAVREAVHYLRAEGALIIFPTGIVDPDPAFLAGSEASLEKWSPSLELFLRQAPQTQIMLSIVSGVLSPGWYHNPITRIRRERFRRQKVAEIFQISQQLLFPNSLKLSPSISFSRPMTVQELRSDKREDSLMPAIIDHAKALLSDHLSRLHC